MSVFLNFLSLVYLSWYYWEGQMCLNTDFLNSPIDYPLRLENQKFPKAVWYHFECIENHIFDCAVSVKVYMCVCCRFVYSIKGMMMCGWLLLLLRPSAFAMWKFKRNLGSVDDQFLKPILTPQIPHSWWVDILAGAWSPGCQKISSRCPCMHIPL